jgi:hypothetical protein
MAFKLGTSRSPLANQGKIESKFSFKKHDSSIPGTPVLHMDLAKGVMGEANNDGTIFLSNKIKPGSEIERHVTMHEMVHLTDMKLGKLAYSDNAIKWNGEVYARKNGKIMYNNEWLPEGSKDFPWEKMPWE